MFVTNSMYLLVAVELELDYLAIIISPGSCSSSQLCGLEEFSVIKIKNTTFKISKPCSIVTIS